VIAATFVLLGLAALGFGYRLWVGPTLTDRVTGLNGLLLVGMGAIAAHAIHTGIGAFLPTLVVVALVGSISTGMVARYVERRADS
jgi:multisubunit Na+/H+ antiporter MnhF subunit